MRKVLISAAAALLLATAASAQTTASGAITFDGTLQGSIQLIFHQNPSNGIQIQTGDGTSAATAALGTVSMYGTPNGLIGTTNFTKTVQSDGFTLAGTFNVEVDEANLGSDAYSLSAQLQATDLLQWTLNSVVLSTTGQVVLASGSYGTQEVQTLSVKIPNTVGAASVGNQINFTATPL